MEIKTRFDFGDKPWKIWTTPTREWKACGFCGESGRIIGKDNESRCCPDCYGRKGGCVHINKGWDVMGQLTIGEIKVETRAEDSVGYGDSMFSNFGPQKAFYKEGYMCKETGIGSGTVHYDTELFHSKEDAEAECKKRNAEKESEDDNL